MSKCIFCGKELTEKDIVVSTNGWAYCKKCKKPLCDTTIQDDTHWIKKGLKNKIIKKKSYMDLMLQGYM